VDSDIYVENFFRLKQSAQRVAYTASEIVSCTRFWWLTITMYWGLVIKQEAKSGVKLSLFKLERCYVGFHKVWWYAHYCLLYLLMLLMIQLIVRFVCLTVMQWCTTDS